MNRPQIAAFLHLYLYGKIDFTPGRFPSVSPMSNYSIKAKYRTDRIRNGVAPLYLQVIINGETKKIDLKLLWPIDKFSSEDLCIKRSKEDKDANDYNIIIRDAINKANEIFKYYRLTDQILTAQAFINEYSHPLAKGDFIKYYEQKLKARFEKKEIVKITWKNHNDTLNKLKKYADKLRFNQFNTSFATDFDRWLKNVGGLKELNGRWGHHKNVKAYLNLAKNDKIHFNNPYATFVNKSTAGRWKPITRNELIKLYDFYKKTEVGTIERRVLQAFIAGGCLTGLRISDQLRIKPDQLLEGNLIFIPWKQRKKGKILMLPLLNLALEIMYDSIRENRQETIFYPYKEQVSNRVLKDIATDAEIRSKLHHHVGKETFGTLYIEMGGDVTSLMKYFDHYKIQTTMKYVHTSQKKMTEDVNKMNAIF